MFKLTVVGGPAKGTSFHVKDMGETSIGRVEGNDVVLQSSKVSKKHCVLVVSNKDVQVKDVGSSNGTFVNGVLTKLKLIRPGDRVSVGDYVLELVKIETSKSKALAPVADIAPLHGLPAVGQGNMPMPEGGAAFGGQSGALPNAPAAPQDLLEKAKFGFEKYVINFVYNLNEKHEWRSLMAGMFVVLVVACATLSVYPVLDRVSEKLTNEAAGRALLLARQMVDRNAPYIYDRQESKLDVSYVEREPGVISAYVIDMDGRIMAPGRKLSQNVSEGQEGVFATSARKLFMNKESAERSVHIYGDMVAAAIPLRIFSAAAGKNITVAVSLVFYDRSTVLFDGGTEALVYIQAVILSGMVAVLIFFALYRLTLRPLLFLNAEMDQVLKGSAQAVEKKFKMEEINPLIDVANTALQRAASAAPGAMTASSVDEVLEALKFAAMRMNSAGLAVFGSDKRIVLWSAYFAEVTGIHSDSAVGQEIHAVARDAAFGAFCDDLFARAPLVGSEPVAEDFEFSGTFYRLEALATGTPGAIKYYLMTLVRPE